MLGARTPAGHISRRVAEREARDMDEILVTTMNDVPGYEIEEVLGSVFGLTVRSRHIGSTMGAAMKSLVGGELRGLTKLLAEGRRAAEERLVEDARSKGADAIIAFRFDSSEMGTSAPRSRVRHRGAAPPSQRFLMIRPRSR
jgi:uncharacterized protein YbjQ (UPF0145 family)